MKLDIKILDEELKNYAPPGYATKGAAGLDLICCSDKNIQLWPNEQRFIKSGVAIHIADKSKAGLLIARSSLATKNLVLANSVGLIDSDYQGEILLNIRNVGETVVTIFPGQRLAQLVIVDVHQVELNFVEDFTTATTRGVGGFGSTGV